MNEALRKARLDAKLTQFQVAELAGITYRSYQNYEYNQRLPDVIAGQQVANALGVPIGEIFPIDKLPRRGG